MRRSARLVFACLSLLGSGVAAHATLITAGIYTLQNATIDGHTVTGTVTINAAGNATAAALTFNDADFDDPGLPYFTTVSYSAVFNGVSQNYLQSSAGQIGLSLNTNADASGYFDLCLGAAQCGTTSGTTGASTMQLWGFYNSATGTSNSGLGTTNFVSGYLAPSVASPAAVTPEPSTLILLGTGIVGVAGAARFRSATATS